MLASFLAVCEGFAKAFYYLGESRRVFWRPCYCMRSDVQGNNSSSSTLEELRVMKAMSLTGSDENCSFYSCPQTCTLPFYHWNITIMAGFCIHGCFVPAMGIFSNTERCLSYNGNIFHHYGPFLGPINRSAHIPSIMILGDTVCQSLITENLNFTLS